MARFTLERLSNLLKISLGIYGAWDEAGDELSTNTASSGIQEQTPLSDTSAPEFNPHLTIFHQPINTNTPK